MVRELERLSRDVLVQEQLMRDVWGQDKEVLSTAPSEADLRDDPEDPTRRLIRIIIGAVHAHNRDMTVLRMQRGKQQRGGYLGGTTRYGYHPVDKELAPDRSEQTIARRIRRLHRDGRSIRAIAALLNTEQTPAKTRWPLAPDHGGAGARATGGMMFELLQTVITVALSAIVGGQVAVTRTRRLQRTIDATISPRDRLPADDPSRVMLEANLRELVEVLVRRQRLRFGPFTQAGFSLGAIAGLASVALAFAGFGALMAAGVVPSASDPMATGEAWAGAAFFLAVGGALGVWAARIARRQLREHPPPAKQSAEAG